MVKWIFILIIFFFHYVDCFSQTYKDRYKFLIYVTSKKEGLNSIRTHYQNWVDPTGEKPLLNMELAEMKRWNPHIKDWNNIREDTKVYIRLTAEEAEEELIGDFDDQQYEILDYSDYINKELDDSDVAFDKEKREIKLNLLVGGGRSLHTLQQYMTTSLTLESNLQSIILSILLRYKRIPWVNVEFLLDMIWFSDIAPSGTAFSSGELSSTRASYTNWGLMLVQKTWFKKFFPFFGFEKQHFSFLSLDEDSDFTATDLSSNLAINDLSFSIFTIGGKYKFKLLFPSELRFAFRTGFSGKAIRRDITNTDVGFFGIRLDLQQSLIKHVWWKIFYELNKISETSHQTDHVQLGLLLGFLI